jgi:hypothetical protein
MRVCRTEGILLLTADLPLVQYSVPRSALKERAASRT